MLTIHTDTRVYKMDRSNPPAACAKSGDILCFETLDCFGGRFLREDPLRDGNREGVNPATGPVFIEGAQPGDVLKVEILKIRLDDRGVMRDGPGSGVTGCALTERSTKILPVSGGMITFNEKLKFPIRPMIGVIGTAPAGKGIGTGTPGSHGGNMDCSRIGEGATLYLPVNVEGALLAMGDLHARMGDGEVEGCGVEIAGAVTAKVTVVKGCSLPVPFLTNGETAAAIYSAPTLDAAAEGAAMAMHGFLRQELGMDAHEAGMVLSVAGELRICQIVDPEMTCRMEIPLTIPETYGYSFA